jgi:hypothetical protein
MASIDIALQQAQQLPCDFRCLKEETLPDGGEVDRDGFRKVRRVELLARLELLDQLIEDQARRAELVQEMGWDATPYQQRSRPRECLDWMIPMSQGHLRSILREWVAHYNGERLHSALGPGVPGPPAGSASAPNRESRRRWTPGALVRASSVLGGLHHEYSLSETPAVA